LHSTIEDIRRLRTSHIVKQNSLHQNDIRVIGAENRNIALNKRGYKKIKSNKKRRKKRKKPERKKLHSVSATYGVDGQNL
jgi:hypothetical protein